MLLLCNIQTLISPLSVSGDDVVQFLLYFGLIAFGLFLLRLILKGLVPFFSWFLYMLFRLFSFPFSILNGLQRHLSKPWRFFYKHHHGSDGFNKFMRRFWSVMKIPFYILLTPLRFANAVFYNIFMHCGFEFYNYLSEVFDPSSRMEGSANLFTWVLLAPIRLVKYSWHFLLTVVESIIWTLVDTIVPALTLYHGTCQQASESITSSPGRLKEFYSSGTWNVGSGNFAGNGIYFAPVRSTALHYAQSDKRVLIVCRVTLGNVLDLGMAPKYVYDQCGHPDATDATRWGLKHGYTTGEWWRSDEGWWEYCMYDWKNRYNESWRIRPLYVEELYTETVHRIRGGMVHWLFRWIVIKDIFKSIFS